MRLRPTGPVFGVTLRGMLVIMSLLAIGFALVGTKVKRARDEQLIVDDILAKGGEVMRSYFGMNASSAAVDRTWFERLLGLELETRTTHVALRGARFTDNDVTRLTRLEALESLSLRDISLAGETLAELAELPLLTHVEVDNSITDAGLARIAALPHVERLVFVPRPRTAPAAPTVTLRYTDAGIAAIGRMAELQLLVLSGAQITDESLRKLQLLPRLDYFQLSHTTVSDDGLAAIAAALPQLRDLRIVGGPLTGAGLAQLLPCAQLSLLDIDGCPISDDGLAGIEALQQLRTVQIGGSAVLTDLGLRSLAKLPHLTRLGINAVNVTDGATAPLANHPSLVDLWLRSTAGPFTNDALAPLKTIKTLNRLELKPSQISAAQTESLRQALPGIVITY